MDRQITQGLRWAAGLGLGVGLMLGAAAGSLWQQPQMTDEQVVELAHRLGMVEKAETSANSAADPAMAGAGAPSQGEAASSDPQSGDRAPAGTDSETPAPAGRTVAYTVSPGMTFEDIADLLKAAGAIEDRHAFLARAEELGAMSRAKPGLYLLHQADALQPADYDEIIQQLVQGPS